MPTLNRQGDLWCAGIAGAGFFGGDFDGDKLRVRVSKVGCGERAFVNDREAMTQDFSRGEHDKRVIAVDVLTGAERIVLRQGASQVHAGAGEWAVFYSDGVRTSFGAHLPAAYVGASTGPVRNDCAGPDGSLAIKEQYHSIGPWHVYRPDGSRWLLTHGDAANLQLLGGERAIWREGWAWCGKGVRAPRPIAPIAWGLKVLETAEGPWLVYQAEDGRVLAHPSGQSTGLVLGPPQDAYGLDAVILPDGRVRVIWAATEGEDPARGITVAHFRTTDARQSLIVATPPPPPPPPPVDEQEPSVRYQPILSYEHVVSDVFNRCTPAQRLLHGFVAEQAAFELRAAKKPAYYFRESDGQVFLEPVAGAVPITAWCVNQKRGDEGDSEDCMSVQHPLGAGGWAVIDVLMGYDPKNGTPGTPTWLDQTQKTIDHGTVGGGRVPRNLLGTVVEPPPDDGEIEAPPVMRDEMKPPVRLLSSVSADILEVIGYLRRLPAIEHPDPPPCPLPHNPPCELPHDGPSLHTDYGGAIEVAIELNHAYRAAQRSIGKREPQDIDPGSIAHLLWGFVVEGRTREDVLESARKRGRGEPD